MKTFVIVLAFLSSSFAYAATPAEILGEGEHHHTPFEKLEHVFNHGLAPQASDFTVYDASAPLANTLNRTCTSWVKPETTRTEITTISQFPILATGRIVVAPATPGTGPLFPARPERTELRQAVLLGAVGMTDSQAKLGEFITASQIELSQSADGFVQRQSGGHLAVLRMHEGLLVVQESLLNEKGEVVKVYAYMYCWSDAQPEPQPAPAPQPVPAPLPSHRSGD